MGPRGYEDTAWVDHRAAMWDFWLPLLAQVRQCAIAHARVLPPIDRQRRVSSFFPLLATRMASTLAIQSESAAVAWLVYSVARRQGASVGQASLKLGFVGLAQFLPLLMLTLPAGHVVDRYDRRRTVQTALFLLIACDLALAGLSLGRQVPLAPVFAITALFAVARAFLQPATSALTPMLTPVEQLPHITAWASLGSQFAATAGPALGGVLSAISAPLAFLVVAICYGVALGAMTLVRGDTRPQARVGSMLTMVAEGLAYLRTTKLVIGATTLDLFAVLLGGAVALIPVFATDIIHGSGWLRAAPRQPRGRRGCHGRMARLSPDRQERWD